MLNRRGFFGTLIAAFASRWMPVEDRPTRDDVLFGVRGALESAACRRELFITSGGRGYVVSIVHDRVTVEELA